ncbi:hypothetical protein F5887DRAFT_1223901 [Amanita rubescens]|nr:hypothetical protein F5887DRAFT_1223901 [Amanita rubescens]
MGLYLLDYGAGNVQSLANTLTILGHRFTWISDPADFEKATSLIFPGVGAFETAIGHLASRGFLEPLRDYIRSGRPYFGICIGMQVLFQSSTESPSPGLGIIPSPIEHFDDQDKSVPHMGWNAAELLNSNEKADPAYYYFVHSYRAKYDPEQYPEGSKYGQEVFISTVRRGNVFGTQFHPEKSGAAGLALIDTWLRSPESLTSPSEPIARLPQPKHRLTKRIIAGDLVVTKGDQYDVREKAADPSSAGAVRNLGKPVALAARYYNEGADELCLLNITSFRHSPLQDQPMLAVVRAAAECVFVPLTIGGGIKDTVDPDGTKRSALEVAGAYFPIGSEAVYAVERLRQIGNPDGTSAIETIAHVYGRQAVVVSIDPRRVYVDPETFDGPYKDELIRGTADGPENERGKAWWYQCTVSGGRENRPLSAVQLARGVETLGAGEILVNSIDRDGTGLGFDLELINLIKKAVRIPVVASSGAGSKEHFVEVFEKTDVEAALAAGIFHRNEVQIAEVRAALSSANINVRI